MVQKDSFRLYRPLMKQFTLSTHSSVAQFDIREYLSDRSDKWDQENCLAIKSKAE